MRGDRGQRDIEEVARKEVQRDEGGDEGGLEVVMVRYGSRRILLYAVMLFVKMKQNDWLISWPFFCLVPKPFIKIFFMNPCFYILLLAFVSCQVFNEELFFYQATRGRWHANRGDTILSVSNPEAFSIQHGFAQAKFSLNVYNITLVAYSFIWSPDVNVKALNLRSEKTNYNDCPLFGKKVVVAVYRVQHRNNQEGCVSEATIRRYFQYLDSHLRLISGNRIRFDMEKSVISNVCCPCSEEECYGPDDYGNFMNKVMDACKPLDPRLDMRPMTRMFFNDAFGSFAGLASLGWIPSFTNNGNYWCINNVNNDPDEMWKWEYNLSVLVHEFGHTMGMNHASYPEEKPTYFLRDYLNPDNYGDSGSVMGGGNYWDTVVTPSHFYYRYSVSKVEPFWYKTAEDVDRKTIRLFAWDHPYSRPFLGIEEARFQDEDMISGIPYKDNMMTLEVPYNRADMCSTISEGVKYGSFYLEYRNKKGTQRGAGNRGVRLIQGRVDKSGYDNALSLLLSAGVDGLFSWGDSVIPVGVWWHPKDADLGTIGIHITKINSVTDWMDEALLDDPVQPLENIPYMELEYTYAPNVKYIPPNQPAPLPSYAFSPNIFGCVMNSNLTGWECKVMGERRFWAYMKPSAHRGHPRVFSLDTSSFISSASSSVVSLPGRQRNEWTHFFGDTTRGRCTVQISQVASPGTATAWLNVQLYRKKIGEADSAFKLYHTGDAVLARQLGVEEGDEVFLMDLYGTEEKVAVDVGIENTVLTLSSKALPGLYEGFVVKKKAGEIVYAARFSQLVAEMKSDRLAIQIIDDERVEVSSAGIPSGRFSFPTMIQPRSLSKWERLPVMFQDWTFGDYLFVDFSGKTPSNLVLYLETDNGEISFDLKRFSGVSDLTLKLTYRQLIAAGAVSSKIDYLWFNKAVTVLSVRPVLASNVGNIQANANANEEALNAGEYRLKGVIGGFQGFVDRSYTGTLNGWKYTVSTTDASGQSVRFVHSGINFSASSVIFIVVIVVVLLIVIFVARSLKKRDRVDLPSSQAPPPRKQSQSSQPKQLQRSTPPPPPPSSAKPVKKSTPPPPPPSSAKPHRRDSAPPPPPPKPRANGERRSAAQTRPAGRSAASEAPPIPTRTSKPKR